MKKILRWAMLLGAAACFFSLFGCGKKHLLDGPGMVNDLNWKAFTLSGSDSHARYNFTFHVESRDFGFFLTGECRNEDGDAYRIDEGVELSGADIRYLRSLNIGDLPDAAPSTVQEEEAIRMDEPTVTLNVTYLDGRVQKKTVKDDFSIQLYQIFLPYFIGN